ncbi:MAG: N-acetylmuramoyl-L-alanine amidase, partial [Candidatus Aureabacteria bacterium]|nr:N-acetylmuramoyl-L-alanine amidase [Candidatus Auribacterota bacterium]
RLLTLDPGTLLKVAGEEGNAYRVELSRNLSASVPAEAVTLEETYPGKPYVVGNSVLDFPGRKIFFAVSGRVPAQVEYLSPSALKVIFYNAAVGTSEINLGSGECACRWEQAEDGRAVFFLEGPLSCYRWSPAWRNGFFELSWTGRPRGKEGRSVLIDPGHGGEQAGAVSPLGIEEKELNLLLARKVAERLTAAGVAALLTRENDSLVEVEKRVDFTRQSGVDLLVSIHFNSAAEFENPRETSGFAVYHYHPPSLELARALQRALGTLGLKDNGVRWKSLAVLRSPRLVSALVEVAFLSNPEDESKIIAPDFLDRAAEAIASGILAYLQD